MDFYNKMPRSKGEFVIFIGVISILSVNIIAPLITCFERGFHLHVWADVLRVLPFIWMSVVALVLLTLKPAERLTRKFTAPSDSFSAFVIINILCSVFMLSIFLTVIGTWIGTRSVSLNPIRSFFYKWPRNFAVSFAVELLIAQPIARFVMMTIHRVKDSRTAA